MMRSQIVTAMSAWALTVALTTVAIEAQFENVTYHDLASMPAWALGKMQVKGAMGQKGSFAVVELPPGFRGTAHHHTQEQIVFGLSGSSETSIGGIAHRLGPYAAAITPPDTEHGTVNTSTTEIATYIEFQPVLRPDWFPPHSKVTLRRSPAPVAIPSNQRVSEDFSLSSSRWRLETRGARSKVLSGTTCRVTIWHLSTPNASVDLTPKGARPEQFLYMLEGHAEIATGSHRREIRSAMLAVISPQATDTKLRPLGKGPITFAVFESGDR